MQSKREVITIPFLRILHNCRVRFYSAPYTAALFITLLPKLGSPMHRYIESALYSPCITRTGKPTHPTNNTRKLHSSSSPVPRLGCRVPGGRGPGSRIRPTKACKRFRFQEITTPTPNPHPRPLRPNVTPERNLV